MASTEDRRPGNGGVCHNHQPPDPALLRRQNEETIAMLRAMIERRRKESSPHATLRPRTS